MPQTGFQASNTGIVQSAIVSSQQSAKVSEWEINLFSLIM